MHKLFKSKKSADISPKTKAKHDHQSKKEKCNKPDKSPRLDRKLDSPKPEARHDRISGIDTPPSGSPNPATTYESSPRADVVQARSSGTPQQNRDANGHPRAIDVMISYSAQNGSFMRKLKEGLQKRDMNVWEEEIGVKAGFDFLNKVGQAIIDAKCFISLLSVDSIKSKGIQDELSLAVLYEKHIYPCILSPEEEIVPAMDTHMRMRLARYEWTVFTDEASLEQKVNVLVSNMKAAISEHSEKSTKSGSKPIHHKRAPTTKPKPHRSSFKFLPERLATMRTFWIDNFSHKQTVPWPEFYKAFIDVYKEALTTLYNTSDREWLIGIVMRKLDVQDPVTDYVTRIAYDDFCTVDGEVLPFFESVQDQALESGTIRDVLSMKSSVRIEAIENLSKFRSPAVVEALLDLLKDPDNNSRAVAAISLARTGEDGDKIVNALLDTLNDKDRLVRESGCLALGHLKASRAVPKILHLWRNDFISHVREAAQVALTQIGGEEAENAIHITKVLSDEIRYLLQE